MITMSQSSWRKKIFLQQKLKATILNVTMKNQSWKPKHELDVLICPRTTVNKGTKHHKAQKSHLILLIWPSSITLSNAQIFPYIPSCHCDFCQKKCGFFMSMKIQTQMTDDAFHIRNAGFVLLPLTWWRRIAKNRDITPRPFNCPFDRSLALLASLVRTAAITRWLARSRARGTPWSFPSQIHAILNNSALTLACPSLAIWSHCHIFLNSEDRIAAV